MKVKEVKKTVAKASKKELLHITKNHTGKMRGMQSLSTSCKTNPNCAKYAQVEGSVCQHCYAQRMTKMYKELSPCLEKNADILTSRILDDEEIPIINASFFRFEAFGDLINTTQLENYFNICRKNPYTHFALWTKNPHIVKKVADKKPENIQIIVSSLYLNKKISIEKMPYIDKVFTVYDKATIKKENININCGGRSCITCLRCYMQGGDTVINEQLK